LLALTTTLELFDSDDCLLGLGDLGNFNGSDIAGPLSDYAARIQRQLVNFRQLLHGVRERGQAHHQKQYHEVA